jgi:hypothetical protein
LQRKPETNVKRRDRCNTIGIYGINNRDFEAIGTELNHFGYKWHGGQRNHGQKNEEYENNPKRVHKSQRPKNCKF